MHYEDARYSKTVHPDLVHQIRFAEEDILIEENGRINAYSNNWRELEIGVIDSEAVSYYLHGNCAALALALHEVLDCELMTLTSSNTIHHAFVQLPDGNYLDIEGIKTSPQMMSQWNNRDSLEIEIKKMSHADFINTWGSLDDFSTMEAALTRDFALVAKRQYL